MRGNLSVRVMRTCRRHATASFAIEPHELFVFPLTDGAVSEKTLAKDTGAGDVTERPRLHLYWLSVSASEMTSRWASLITYYINFTRTVCVCECVCARLSIPKTPPCPAPCHQPGPGVNDCAVRALSDLQHMGGLETHSYVFSAPDVTEYGLSGKKAISIIPTGLEDGPGVKLTTLTEYYGLQSPLTVTVQANLQCSVSTQPPWTCSEFNWI